MRHWPDQVDSFAIVGFIALWIGLPILGYWLMVADLRAYLRALKGALVVVKYHFSSIPNWARRETPACVKAMGLRLPCTEEDLKAAYRQLAEQHHPDRGGDRKLFARLKSQYEEATAFLRELNA
jgi:hypothetical protein